MRWLLWNLLCVGNATFSSILDSTILHIPMAEVARACKPLIDRTIETMEPLSSLLNGANSDIAGIHLVGGTTSLPIVPRRLRELCGRKVHRSPHPTPATAIGLAVAADAGTLGIGDRLSRGFGVFRETEFGGWIEFDVLTDQTTRIAGTTIITRKYRCRHNIGVFRFVEFSRTDAIGEPVGDLIPPRYRRFSPPLTEPCNTPALNSMLTRSRCRKPITATSLRRLTLFLKLA